MGYLGKQLAKNSPWFNFGCWTVMTILIVVYALQEISIVLCEYSNVELQHQQAIRFHTAGDAARDFSGLPIVSEIHALH